MLLTEYLQKEINLSADISERLDKMSGRRFYPKGHTLLEAGSRSKKVFYLEKGLMRLYYLKDGKNITNEFIQEKDIYLPIENVFLNEHFPFYLETLEDCQIRTVDYTQIENLLDSDIKLQKFVRFLMVSHISLLNNHIHNLQFRSAQERYLSLLKTHPRILLRAPLGHIASYLGITQQTLSVIRAEKRS